MVMHFLKEWKKLNNFTKVLNIENNVLEFSKGLKDSEDNYVDLELYDVYHPETTEEITLPIPEERLGYTFNGWYDNPLFAGDVLTAVSIDFVGTLYAKWDEEGEEPSVLEATMEFGDAKFSGDGSSQNGEKTIDGLVVIVTSSTAYWDGNENNSLRLGSSKNQGSITLTFGATVKITKVTVYASQYDGAVSVKVNDLTAQKVTNASGSDYIGYEFIVDSLNAFTVSSVKTTKSRIQIQKIVIEYELK